VWRKHLEHSERANGLTEEEQESGDCHIKIQYLWAYAKKLLKTLLKI